MDKSLLDSLKDPGQKKLYKDLIKWLPKASEEEKNEMLAFFFAGNFHWAKSILDICERIMKRVEKVEGKSDQKGMSKEIKQEIKEIENTLSLGIPGWIKYTRSSKKRGK